LILIKCKVHTHHSIALETLYLKSFTVNSIAPSVWPQIISENGQSIRSWRAMSAPVFVNLQPSASSNRFRLKSKFSKGFMTYRLM